MKKFRAMRWLGRGYDAVSLALIRPMVRFMDSTAGSEVEFHFPDGHREDTSFLRPFERSSYSRRSPMFFHGRAHLLHGYEAVEDTPRLIIPDTIFRELYFSFLSTPDEIQLWGLVDQEEDNSFIVRELIPFPHDRGAGSADLDQDAFPAWLESLEEQGKDITKMRLQVHSHGLGEAFFSSKDLQVIKEEYSCKWIISLVGDRSGTLLARLDVYQPIPLSLALPILIEPPLCYFSEEERTAWSEKLNSIGVSPSLPKPRAGGRYV